MNFNIIEMENKQINGEAPQAEEEQRLYENLRNWDDEIINQKMEDLGIPNVKLTSKRKYILGMIDTLADINTKKFFLRNSDFMEIAKISKTPFVETIKYFSKLGIIKRESGVRGKASQYKFNEKNLKKLPLKNQTLIEKTDQTLNGVSCSVSSVSSEYGLGKGSGEKQSVENQPPQSQSHTQPHSNSQLHLQPNSYSQLQPHSNSQLQEHEQVQDDLVNNNIDNTLMEELLNKVNELYEKVDSIYNLINDDRRVQSEVNVKLLEGIKKLHSSISSSRNSKETVSSITSNNKEVQESVNKEETVTTNCKEIDTSSSTSTLDKIMSFQVKSLEEQEQQTRKLQEASKQTSEANTKVTVVENNSNNGERNYVLNKLECEITKPFINSIVHANSYENLLKIRKDFKNEFNKCYSIHKDVLTKSDVDPLIDKFYEEYDKKENELKQEPSSNSNGIVQSEENNTKDSEQKPSKDETVEATDVETSPKEDETDNTRFQRNDKTSTDSENCQEKEDSTAEPSTVESNKVQVSETYTPNCEEKSQEELDKEFDKQTSTMFLIDYSKKSVQTKKFEEVQFPKTEKIVLSSEEQKQFQELVNNQSINAVIKKYAVERNFEEILTEIRKAVTIGKYQERVVQAYIDYTWNTYTFDCTVQDAMKPIEITNEDTVTTTVSTPKGDSFEKFKKSLDNIENNVKECGDNLPFGNNPKSRYQEDEEETVEESNSDEPTDEEIAMAATSQYDETKDAIF